MNFRKRILNPLFFLLNVVAAFGFILALLAPYVSPRNISVLAYAATGFPLLLLINVLFLIWWLVQLNKRILLPLLCLAIAYPALKRTYRFGEARQEIRTEDRLRVMTYNVRGFNRYQWLEDEEIPTKIAALISKHDPDVILFQEYHHNTEFNLDGYHYRVFGDNNKGTKSGLAVYSRFPISSSRSIFLDDINKSANLLISELSWKGKKINLYNVHLASVGLEQPDYETLENPDYEQSEHLRSGLRKIASRLHYAYRRRATQSKNLSKLLESDSSLVILGGDFNDVPLSYPYHDVQAHLDDSFVDGGGSGFGSSFVRGPFPLRIDYLWHSSGFRAANYEVSRLELSDHYPVRVDFTLQP